MKHYNLDRIQPILRDCDNFFIDLIRAYKMQGIKIPDRLKKLKENVKEQLHKIDNKEK